MDSSRPVKYGAAAANPHPPRSKHYPRTLLCLALFVSLGVLAALHPFLTLVVPAATAVLGIGWLIVKYVRRAELELWQVLVVIAMSGYMILNYGFSNLVIRAAGVPLIISYSLMYTALILAVLVRQPYMRRVLKEPTNVCLGILLLLTLLHLLLNLSLYGLWAIRDASLVLDGLFLIPGMLWVTTRRSRATLMKWLMFVFVVNLVYSLTRPWEEAIEAWSPQSGLFVPVSVFGNYRGSYFYLLNGALFCILLARYVVKWPRWILMFLAIAQVFGLAIHQARSTYVGLAVAILVLMFFGKAWESAKLTFTLTAVVVVIWLLTAVGGFEISGRIGPVDLAFFKDHVRSITGAEHTPGMPNDDRVDWYDQAVKRFEQNPVLGEGFGRPLLDVVDEATGAAVRQPHNSTISVIARLGLVGLAVWIAFHLCLLQRFYHAFRQRHYCDKETSDFVLWLFLYYVTFMIVACVEPAFEFPEGAVPFYFFMGVALGTLRWRIPSRAVIAANDGVLFAPNGIGVETVTAAVR